MNIKFFAVYLLLATVLFSCKKNDGPNPNGKLEVSFANEVDGQPITLGVMNYTNAAGNNYRVDLLKYYVTNFTLVKADGTETNYKNYKLINAEDASTCKFTLDTVDNATYTAVKFNLGVDPDHNHTLGGEGDLDPVLGMIWDWNTGYIFFKHEGAFMNASNASQGVFFHYGTDRANTIITVPVTPFEVQGNTRKLSLKFNLNKLYTTPYNIDFNVDNNHQSTSSSDRTWIDQMKENFADAFSFDKVQ